MSIQVLVWLGAVMVALIACAVLFVLGWGVAWLVALVWEWWWRDRVALLLEDDWQLGFNEDTGQYEELPPERTWEQMTSHQLPTGRLCAACGSPDCPGLAAVDYCPRWQEAEARNARGEYLTTHPLGAQRERRPAAWEFEHRAHYAAMGLEYPSGLMARVREAAQ